MKRWGLEHLVNLTSEENETKDLTAFSVIGWGDTGPAPEGSVTISRRIRHFPPNVGCFTSQLALVSYVTGVGVNLEQGQN